LNPAPPRTLPPLRFPDALPITAHREAIADALARNRVLIVCGDTGSGKTTQLPKIALAAGRGRRGLIGITQPRRLAALAMAARVAEELGCEPGGFVGVQHRFERRLSEETRIKFMTDGILLAETRRDPLLRAYDTLILDEAHERSLNIDFLLGILRTLLPRRRDLRLVISSATLDAERFAAFFAAAMQLLAKHFPGPLNGHAQGLFYGFSSGLGGVLGALVAGQLWPFGDGRVAFLAAGAFALLGCVIAWIWVVPRRGSSPESLATDLRG